MAPEHLRHIRKSVEETREDVRETKLRMTHVEENLAMGNRKLERIERSLDLAGA